MSAEKPILKDELLNLEGYSVALEKSAPEEKPTLTKIKDLVEVIGKISIGVVALCYVLGLIVVNLYFSQYGVYSLSLFRLNYIMAGIWLFAPIFIGILSALGVFVLAYSLRPARYFINKRLHLPFNEETYKPIFWGNLVFFILQFGILVLVISVNLRKKFSFSFSSEWVSSILWALIVVIPFILLVYMIYRRNPPPTLTTSYAVFLYLSLALIFYIFVFSRNLYGDIPPHFGGGGTKNVQLLLETDTKSKEFFVAAGVEFIGDSNRTNNLELLYATDDEYVFFVHTNDIDTIYFGNGSTENDNAFSVITMKK